MTGVKGMNGVSCVKGVAGVTCDLSYVMNCGLRDKWLPCTLFVIFDM